jgi:hypothetical protein
MELALRSTVGDKYSSAFETFEMTQGQNLKVKIAGEEDEDEKKNVCSVG